MYVLVQFLFVRSRARDADGPAARGRLRLPCPKQGSQKTGALHDNRGGTGSAVNGDQIHNSYEGNPD